MRVLKPAAGRDGPAAPGPADGERCLDLSGLKCPLPALYTRKALRALPAGRALIVVCTDPLSMIDIPNLAREEGARLEAAERDEGGFRFRIVATAKAPQS